ncbi:MAG TPA: copper resistance CopC family protein [Candidatus Limnocylindrales bacterium]|jgi:hypothetical protein
MRPVARLLAIVAAGSLILLSWAVALGHAELVRTTPEDGATVPAGAIDIIATYDEPVGPRSHMELHRGGRQGEVVSNGAIDGRTIRIGLDGLPAGAYTVTWVSQGQDGEIARGTWSFTVLAPTPSPSPSPSATASEPPSASATSSPTPSPSAGPSASPSPSPDPGATASGGDVVVPILAAIAIVVLGLGALLLRGRRSP